MKLSLSVLVCCLPMLSLAACSHASHSHASSDEVKVVDGHGTATVWGITFDVDEPGSATAGATAVSSSREDSMENDLRNELVMGDVTIVIEKQSDAAITLNVNGEAYGTLMSGDAVAIDAERNIEVNGVTRKP
jgi:hypothetical protein